MSRFRNALFILSLFLLICAAAASVAAQESKLDQLNAQAERLGDEGKYAEAVGVAKQAVQVAEAGYGGQSPQLAAALNQLADLYNMLGDTGSGTPLCQRALAIREKALGPESAETAESLATCGGLYNNAGQFEQAEAAYRRALAIQQKAAPESKEVAVTLNGLALVQANQAKFGEAEKLYQQALAIEQKVLGPEDREVGTTLTNLGEVYRGEGRYPEDEKLQLEALAIREKLPPDHPDRAEVLNNLAVAERLVGKYAQAEAHYQQALAVIEKSLGESHPWYAALLNNFGDLYAYQGKYREAEEVDKRAIAIKEKVSGPESDDVAITVYNLAGVYREQGNYAAAEEQLARALKIDEKALGPEHPGLAPELNELGLVYRLEKKYPEAAAAFQRAIAIWEKALGPDYPEMGFTLDSLGFVYLEQGRYAEAEALMQRSLRISDKAFGADSVESAQGMNNLGALYFRQGKYEAAEPLYLRSLAIKEKNLGAWHREIGSSLLNLTDLYYASEREEKASGYFDRTLENLRLRFDQQFAYMTEKERLQFLATASDAFPQYFSFCYHYRERDPALLGKMYDVVLWRKGFVATSIAALRSKIEASGDPEARALLEQVAGKKAELAGLINSPLPDRAQWLKQIQELEQEINGLERRLVERSGALAEEKKLAHPSWREVQKALRPGEAAVELVRFPYFDGKKFTGVSYYVALIVTPESPAPALVLLGDAKEIEGKTLVQYQQQVQSRGMEAAPGSKRGAAAPAQEAYALLWKPLAGALAGRRRVYLAPDGVLNQAPLGLLAAPGGRLLMQEYDLRLLSSTKDLLRAAPAEKSRSAVLIGDPAFDLSPEAQRAARHELQAPAKAEAVQMAALPHSQLSRDQGSGLELPPLPGTGVEVQSLARLLAEHHWQASTYTGRRALEEEVKRVQSPRVLHLATHGFFLPDQRAEAGALEDPMLRSGLFFAGADRALAGQSTPQDLDDGVLTAYEATSLDLEGTELVVLSACNTGQGEVQNGEGVFGLRRALQEAGAQAVMMSLWPVPDRETQELMTLFYRKWLAGVEKHEALRQAELEERAVVRKRYGRDLPYYWGAFVLVGR